MSIMDLPKDTPGIEEIIERAYLGWREITVPVAPISERGTLLVEVVSGPETGQLELDWIRFTGNGVSEMK